MYDNICIYNYIYIYIMYGHDPVPCQAARLTPVALGCYMEARLREKLRDTQMLIYMIVYVYTYDSMRIYIYIYIYIIIQV
jgi:hypothetical protein